MAPGKKNLKKAESFSDTKNEGIRAPFFIVRLANTLETAGVEFGRAHETARRISDDIFGRGLLPEVPLTPALYRRVHQLLMSELGPGIAARYLRLRKLAELPKPLVIFLGGSTGSGKNTVAMELAHRLGITTVISTDVIREIMRSLFSEELMPMLHTSSYLAHSKLWLPLKEGREQETLAFREQALRVNSGLKGFIKRSIKERTSLIINGVHILPDMLGPEDFRGANAVKVFLYVSSREEHRMRFYNRGASGEARPAEKYLENFSTIRLIQKYILRRARDKGFFCINNRDSRAAAIKIISHITGEMEKRGVISSREA